MCGIVFATGDQGDAFVRLFDLVKRRGPDGSVSLAVDAMWFGASVLHVQGNEMAPQPFVDDEGNILLWNGEVFDGLLVDCKLGDTIAVATTLHHATRTWKRFDELTILGSNLTASLSPIEGPFAFVYFHRLTQTVHFGRDSFGRRSLLAASRRGRNEIVSSVWGELDNAELAWSELPIGGIYSSRCESGVLSPSVMSLWPPSRVRLGRTLQQDLSTVGMERSSYQFLQLLQDSVSRRVKCVFSESTLQSSEGSCRIGVLFSGGIDSVLLSACLHLALNPTEPIELINVAFHTEEERVSPDRLAAIAALLELKSLFPSRNWILINVDVASGERTLNETCIRRLIHPCDTHMDLNIGTAFWFAARGHGYILDYDEDDAIQAYHATENGRPLLRVGGVGAALSKGVAEVRWGQKQGKATSRNKCSGTTCKRISKEACSWGLCKKCCMKRLKEQESPSDPCPVHTFHGTRRKVSCSLDEAAEPALQGLDPLEATISENVDNLTAGKCRIRPRRETVAQCRVLLVGIGADEQLAGYGRHRTVYLQSGREALEAEMAMDLERLWKRNLGRDDRCISDHGRESWFPYLDEKLVRFVQSLAITDIANLDLPSGEGDKKILRDAAKLIGLGNCAEFVKRAIQFGTRIAKDTNQQYHGSNRRGKGTNKI